MDFSISIFTAIPAFLLGLIVGSFINALVFRLNTGFSLWSRSKCFSCGKNLEWYELIPILSFLFLRGRCSVCKTRISLQYPTVEFLTGLVFFFLAERFLVVSDYYSLAVFLFFATECALLIAISVYDLRHTIIPDSLVWLFSGLALFSFYFLGDSFLNHLLAGLILSIPLASLWLFSGGKWMGLGDGKLALGIGFLLGTSSGITAVIFAFWIGALVGIFLIIISNLRKSSLSLGKSAITMKSELPFGPFLALGTVLVLILDIDFTFLLFLF